MRTRNSYFTNNSSETITRRRNKRHTSNVVEPELYTIVEVVPMADNQTMKELLQAHTKGYGEAIVIPEINADHFEIRTNLLQLVQVNMYHGFEKENPQTHPLNAAAGGNLLSKTTREALQIIENKSKVCYSRNKPNVSRINIAYRENTSKTDERIDKLADQISTLVDIFAKKVVTPAPVKAVEKSCVTCGGPHAHYNCDATNSNQPSVCVATGTYNQVAPQNRACNYMAPPSFALVQNSQNRFNHNQGQGNNFNRGNNFHGNQPFQVLNNQAQQGLSSEFSSYKKANDQMKRNMKNQINSLKGEFKNEIQNIIKTQQTVLMEQQNAFQNNLQNMLSGFFQNQSSTLGTLPSNTIPNPKGEMKAITTHNGVAYKGPSIPTNPSPKKVVERETDPIPEPDVPKTLPKPNILYPSRLNDQKLCEKATNKMEKEEYAQEILGFSKNSSGGNPTSTSEPILSDSSLSLTPFMGSDFILEEIEAYLKDESISPEIDHANCDPEGDICLIEKLLNNDPFQLPSMDLK
nr:reverse transcriptase domain-containing protein [Tanacetum cinerariifolium]